MIAQAALVGDYVGQYGEERYEKVDFQRKVKTIFEEQLKDDTWVVCLHVVFLYTILRIVLNSCWPRC